MEDAIPLVAGARNFLSRRSSDPSLDGAVKAAAVVEIDAEATGTTVRRQARAGACVRIEAIVRIVDEERH